MSARDPLDRTSRWWNGNAASQVAQLLVLGLGSALAKLALLRAHPSAFVDIAELLFRISLSGYWIYRSGVAFVEHLGSADTPAVESAMVSSMRPDAARASLLTAIAVVILAIASLIGAQIEMMDAGHPLVAMLTVLAGVIDAKILTDKAAETDLLRR